MLPRLHELGRRVEELREEGAVHDRWRRRSECRARQLASFPSYQVIEILKLRVLNVDASFTNHVSKLSSARVAGKLEGSDEAGLRMFKKIDIGSIAMHTIDERGKV